MSSILGFFTLDFFYFVLTSFSAFFAGLIALCFLLSLINHIVDIGRSYYL